MDDRNHAELSTYAERYRPIIPVSEQQKDIAAGCMGAELYKRCSQRKDTTVTTGNRSAHDASFHHGNPSN
jgi:hypothetical protein